MLGRRAVGWSGGCSYLLKVEMGDRLLVHLEVGVEQRLELGFSRELLPDSHLQRQLETE